MPPRVKRTLLIVAMIASYGLMAWLAFFVEGGWKYALALLVLPYAGKLVDGDYAIFRKKDDVRDDQND